MRICRWLAPMCLATWLVLSPLHPYGCVPGTTTGGGTTLFNTAPTVVITTDITRGIAPLTVHFSSSGSIDDGLIVARAWDFGDGQTSQEISPAHTFQTTGQFTVTLTLTDDRDAQASRTVVISVTQAPIAVISVDRRTAPAAPAIFNFDGSGSRDPDGTITKYQWDFGDGSRELVPVVVHTFASAGAYRVRLTVTDDTGVTNSSSVIIQVGIPEPDIEFRVPPADRANVVVSPASPLWVSVTFSVEPGVPRTIRAGLDSDRDQCEAQADVFDATSGDLALTLANDTRDPTKGHTGPVRAAVFSPDAALALTGSDDGTARLWVVSTGELLRAPDTASNAGITSVAFAPDGTRYVYGATDGAVSLRDVASGVEIRSFGSYAVAVNGVAFSHDGARIVAGADDNTATVFDAQTAQVINVLGGVPNAHTAAVTSVAFAPSNSNVVLTGSADATAKLWRAEQGDVVSTFTGGHTAGVSTVAFSPDGEHVLTGGEDGKALIWNILGIPATIERTFAHPGVVDAVAFSPDGTQALTGCGDGTARLFDVATADTVRELTPCVSAITAVDFSNSGDQILLGVAARNDIRLDTIPPGGNDLNLTIPAPLDLSVLTASQVPGSYFLWTEVDTDRSAPKRAYAAANINVVEPFTSSITAGTPRVPFVADEAAIIVGASTNRQIFSLGPLRQGDRLHLSLLSVPGYGDFFETTQRFSVLVTDFDQEMYVWYQDGFILFSPNSRLIIGHDSPDYFVIVDGCRPPACSGVSLAQSISASIERQVGLTLRPQQIFLNFDGGANIVVGDATPVTILPFLASDLNPLWVDTPGQNYTQTVKTAIISRLSQLYANFDLTVVTSDDATPPERPFETIYFGGHRSDFYGRASFIDPRDDTRAGFALVDILAIAQDFPALDPTEMGHAIGNSAGHQTAHMLGLRHTLGGATDLMDSTSDVSSAGLLLIAALLDGDEEYNGQIGIQDPTVLLDETVGPHP